MDLTEVMEEQEDFMTPQLVQVVKAKVLLPDTLENLQVHYMPEAVGLGEVLVLMAQDLVEKEELVEAEMEQIMLMVLSMVITLHRTLVVVEEEVETVGVPALDIQIEQLVYL